MKEPDTKLAPKAFPLPHFASLLAISTLIAAVAIPAWFGQGDVTLERAAVLLARDLRAVQNHAVISGHNIHIDFFSSGDGYRALNESGAPVALFSDGAPLARRYNEDGVFQGVRVHSVSFENGERLTYDPNGFALTGGEVILALREDRVILRISRKSGWVVVDGLSRPWRDSGR